MIPFAISFILWAVVHSVTAAPGPKAAIRRAVGEKAYNGLYRLAYNIFAVVTFAPVLFLLATEVPRTPLWVIPQPWSLVVNAIQLAGLLGLIISLLQTDVWEFVGLRQAIDYLAGDGRSAGQSELVTHGTYAFVRHPLYFFSLVVLWLNPVVTLDVFIFNVLSTIYFGVGSHYEEKRLESQFGDAYREYKRQVPYLFPVKLPQRVQ